MEKVAQKHKAKCIQTQNERRSKIDNSADDTIESGKMPRYPFSSAYASLVSLTKMKGHMNVKLAHDQYAGLKSNPFVGAFDLSMQTILGRLTACGGSDDIVNDMGN